MTEFNDSYNKIKLYHDNIYRIIEEAIALEEIEKPEEALLKYKAGIGEIDKALSIPVELPNNEKDGDNFTQIKNRIYKMKCTRAEVLLRIGSLYRNAEKRKSEDSGSELTNGSSSPKRNRTYCELAEVLHKLQSQINADGNSSCIQNTNIELLFYCEGVKVYYIESEGEVTSSLEDSTLRIVRIGEDPSRNLNETVFLQIIKTRDPKIEIGVECGETSKKAEDVVIVDDNKETDPSFIYPLVAGVSPCFRTEYGAFILPDLHSTDGGAIGLIVPADCDEIVLEIMITFLNGVITETGLIKFGDVVPGGSRGSFSDTVSSNIVTGAGYISQGLIYTAEKAGQLMNFTTPYLLSKMRKSTEAENYTVPENVHTSLKVAKVVTGAAARGAGFISGKVGDACSRFGGFLAPHVQKQGSKILNSFGMKEEDAEEKMTDALKITAGAVEGFGTIYHGLESSAIILGTHLSENTVKIVEHKYGADAGKAAEHTLDTVGNLINVNRNFGIVTPRGFFKSAGKNTGKGILRNLKSKNYMDPDYLPANNLYPNLNKFAEKINAVPSTSRN